jgi:hypothetical protein
MNAHSSKFAIAWILVSLVLVGCGNPRGIPMVSVSGRVKFDSRDPPAAGKLIFSPVEPNGDSSQAGGQKWAARPGKADFDERGYFEVSSFETGDGLVPGNYLVTVLCYREIPTLVNADAVSYVPRNFRHQVSVPADGPSSLDLEIEVPLKK